MESYEKVRRDAAHPARNDIKWNRDLDHYRVRGIPKKFEKNSIVKAEYRPFGSQWLYFDQHFNGMIYQLPQMFGPGRDNPYLSITDPFAQKPWMTLAARALPDLHLVGAAAAAMIYPRYRYTKSGERVDNITDWAVAQFAAHYGTPLPSREGLGVGGERSEPPSAAKGPSGAQTRAPTPDPSLERRGNEKDAIFAYCYAVLHDPLYRDKYALNLKREFPRIPFYDDFAQWVAWGEALLKLHIDYESVAPFKLTRVDTPNPRRAKGTHPKPKLKSDPAAGLVVVDEDTQLSGIPPEAWTYRLGNRSAIDWVLDQHKEKTPRDPTIRAKFNTYKFADHKEGMIALLARVVTVSLATVKITAAMRTVERSVHS